MISSSPRRPRPRPRPESPQHRQAPGRRRMRLVPVAAAVLILGGTAATLAAVTSRSGPPGGAGGGDGAATVLSGPIGPEGIPLEQGPPLAGLDTAARGQPTAGIQCNPSEQVVYHIHAHLTIFVNGQARSLPAGVGIVEPQAQQTSSGPFYGATACYYWLHVHAQDGVIHIESPSVATYTLGQFFALWGQPLDRGHVGPADGSVIAYVNGIRYNGDPAAITLTEHEDIQLEVGTPVVPPLRVDWSRSGL